MCIDTFPGISLYGRLVVPRIGRIYTVKTMEQRQSFTFITVEEIENNARFDTAAFTEVLEPVDLLMGLRQAGIDAYIKDK